MNGISISYNEGQLSISSQFEKELNASPEDLVIANHFIDFIKSRTPAAALTLERRSEDYLSLCVGASDFLRFKYTARARWISVDVFGLNISPSDPLFAAQKNKNQRFWKAAIQDVSELSKFDDIVFSSFQKNSGGLI